MSHETVISLESYAAVMAGLGAGLDLTRALACADVLPAAWDRASEYWQSQIDESAASDLSLLVAFDAALLAARRRFEPTAEPIESELRAWSHFRRHLVTAVDPLAFLAEHGISLATYTRIEADWANRTLADEALAATLRQHLAAPLEECPALTLTPSPLLLAPQLESPAGASRQPRGAFQEDRAAAPPPSAVPPSAFSPRVSPSEASRYLHEDGPMEQGVASTALIPASVPEPPLPFRSDQGAGARRPVDVSTTAVAPLSHEAPALPFDANASWQADATREAQPAPSWDAGGTVAPPLVPARPALPFRRSPPSSEHLSQQAATTPAPELASLPDDRADTALSLAEYASLCAELSVFPGDAERIFRRYGLETSQSRQMVDAIWKERLRRDRDQYETWENMYREYNEYWTKHRTRGH